MAIGALPLYTHKKSTHGLEHVISVKQGVIKLSKSNSSVPVPKSEGGSGTQPRDQYLSHQVMVAAKDSIDLTSRETWSMIPWAPSFNPSYRLPAIDFVSGLIANHGSNILDHLGRSDNNRVTPKAEHIGITH